MKIYKLADMSRGWIIGDFDAAAFRTNNCEVAIGEHSKGFSTKKHYHEFMDEISIVISGKVRVNDSIFEKGDIFHIEKGEVSDIEYLVDSVLVVVKTPAVAWDKIEKQESNMKVVIGILTYNMPDMTEVLVNKVKEITKIPYELIVFDNGSKPENVRDFITHRKENNIGPTDGYNEIVKIAKEKNADYLWIITHDVLPIGEKDQVRSMIEKCMDNPSIGVIHPSVDEYFEWFKGMYHRAEGGVTTGHKFLDFIAPMYTKEALDILGWNFDDRFWSWGIDQDSCLQLRLAKKQVAIDHDIIIHHEQGAMIKQGIETRWKDYGEFCNEQGKNFSEVMIKKYGHGYRGKIDARYEWE